jgi:hypothetical protein
LWAGPLFNTPTACAEQYLDGTSTNIRASPLNMHFLCLDTHTM